MSFFPNTDPTGNSKTRQNRTACANEFTTFIQNSFPQGPLQPVTPCFGSDVDEQNQAAAVLGKPPGSNAGVEELGEMGAIFLLQEFLAKNHIQYDDNGLKVFAGANAFNLVYFHPATAPHTHAIILEAKGGNSQLNDRWDVAKLARVSQGTADYAETIVEVMAASKDADRRKTGLALQALLGQTPPAIAYIGVQTKYSIANNEVYNPVPIFMEEV